ncbi:MAG TPA: hypothetical protein VFU05_14290 [Cyclobacteriaceae bacterium]|nr:hypothetical protein [Cyclobacteriaceae bacterium]
MKKFSLLALLILMLGCQEDTINPKKGFINFSFSNNTEGGRIGDAPAPVAVLISLADANDNVIEQDKRLPLYAFGSGLVSENLQLATGNYKLMKFMVLAADNTVIFATPVEGSPLAHLVNDPLPMSFVVTENGTTLVTPQVVPVTSVNTPENFGYVSFGFQVVGPMPRIREVVYYNYQSGAYNKQGKHVYFYQNNKLIKKQYFTYLPEYWTFALIHSEIYNYENDKLSTIDVLSANPNIPLETPYFFQYLGDKIIQDVYLSYNDQRIHRYESTIGQYEATFIDTYTYSTDPALAEVYRHEAILDDNGNLVKLVEYSKDGIPQMEATYSGYIEKMNPLQERVRYPAIYDPLIFNRKLNTKVQFKNLPSGTDLGEREYSFEFEPSGRPKTIFVKYDGVNMSKMELVY